MKKACYIFPESRVYLNQQFKPIHIQITRERSSHPHIGEATSRELRAFMILKNVLNGQPTIRIIVF